ncbi:helix-turn-helix domain-containing protein [Actinomadura nitritigenes]|uniref:Helix-turn-helix domain-containing protein n=1 Tax=Actinomadura nitritigenes TaxID=134602 RepID=A0ABS3RHB7_9ACTN|nr:helix-turn-helix domain-containing protein [Actinomadura nitritigenes]MBO2444999.1 helix-turn-helix domain-containing protein [Actinomadura nitritigenes]
MLADVGGVHAVTRTFDSRPIAPADRAEALREIVTTEIVPVTLTIPPSGAVFRAAVTDAGPLRFTSIRSSTTAVERTARLARDDLIPSVFLGLQMTGSSLVVQDGKETVLRPGELVLYDSTAPFLLADLKGVRQYRIRIPMENLALPRDLLRQVRAVRLTPGLPLAGLASTYFQHIVSRPGFFSQPGSEAVGQPGIELIRALIATQVGASAITKESMRATLRLRILEYARANLGDPELNATQIAVAHHISTRHLYNVLAEGDISLADWIRTQRLEAVRNELGRPGARLVRIASVAQRWGFRDPSSFGRVFRAAYGLSPREWRDTAGSETSGSRVPRCDGTL